MYCHICRSGVFIVNFEHISHLVLVFLLLTLNMQLPTGQCPILKKTKNIAYNQKLLQRF